MQSREAIILAGGFGTRLSHIVSDVPKPMAPVCGRPFLCYILDRLARHHFTHIVLSTGHMHEKIEAFFGNEYNGIKISYARETTPLGTGGGMLFALQKCTTDNIVVLNGDTLFDIDFNSLIEFHQKHNPDLTMVLRHVENVSRYGEVCVDDRHRVISFREKDASQGAGLINGGIYVVKKSLFDGFQQGQRFSFETDILQSQYQQRTFRAYVANNYFIDIGIPEDYHRAQKEFESLK